MKKNVAVKASYERSERVGPSWRETEKCKSAFNEIRSSGIGRRILAALPDTPSSLSSFCALNDVPRQVQRRGFPVRWKVRRLDSRFWRRILPINVSPFFSLSLSFFLFFPTRSVFIEPRRQRAESIGRNDRVPAFLMDHYRPGNHDGVESELFG